jgi:hypothetical protein
VPTVPVIIVMVVVTMTLIIAGVILWSDDHDHGGLRFGGKESGQSWKGQDPEKIMFHSLVTIITITDVYWLELFLGI